MTFEEQIGMLSDDERQKVECIENALNLSKDKLQSVLQFKFVLEGTRFKASISADTAHAIWKMQVAYYRLVALVLHGDPTITLTSQEKELFLLNFKISEGSTEGVANIGDMLVELFDRGLEKMELWQILALVVVVAAAYCGVKFLQYRSENKKTEAQIEQRKIDEAMLDKLLATNKEIVQTALEAGAEGRRALLKGVYGIDSAEIGARNYTKEDIQDIRRRASRVKASIVSKVLNVTVDGVDSRDKDTLYITLREKGSDQRYKADLKLDYDDEEDLEEALNLIWNSARYPDRYFWADLAISTRRGKIESVSVLAVANRKEDLAADETDEEEI